MTASLLDIVDHLRSRVLRWTSRIPLLRTVFLDRAWRLGVLFMAVCAVGLTVATLFPMWVLLLGPMLYGVPHLLASLRFTHYTIATEEQREDGVLKGRALRLFSTIFSGVAGLRILTDVVRPPWISDITSSLSIDFAHSNALELGSLVASFVGCAWIYRRSLGQSWLALVICTAVVGVAWQLPLMVTGVLLILHNFVPFPYWIAAARPGRERWVAGLSFGVFALAHVLIFSGVLDDIYSVFTPAAEIRAAGLRYPDIGKMIVPWSADYKLWFHATVAYAFGQSMHYFVWLKAIPDSHHYHSTPTSFRQSYRFLKADFGPLLFKGALMLLIAMAGAWALMGLPEARVLYFAIASYHGYLEIAGLGLLRFRADPSGPSIEVVA